MSPTVRPSYKALLDFAHELADTSGEILRPYFRKRINVENKAGKGAYDPVSAADRAAERALAGAIAKRWPDHGIVGEEYGSHNEDAALRWIVDPIDGTRAFIMGSPLWGTLIGFMDGEEPLLGMMDQPFTRERFWAGPKASYLAIGDGKARRIATRACASLDEAVLSTTHPDLFQPGKEIAAFMRLKAKARMTRYGGDCYSYCLLAAGFIDVVVEAGLKPYDIVALIPIVERAGGRVTTWKGEPATNGGRIVASGDARLHEEVLAALAR